jgi:hypothetical protein
MSGIFILYLDITIDQILNILLPAAGYFRLTVLDGVSSQIL